jgi:hypothetical protein
VRKPKPFDIRARSPFLFEVSEKLASEMAERAAERAATVYCAALNELYAALGVTTQAEALQRIADLRLHEGH